MQNMVMNLMEELKPENLSQNYGIEVTWQNHYDFG